MDSQGDAPRQKPGPHRGEVASSCMAAALRVHICRCIFPAQTSERERCLSLSLPHGAGCPFAQAFAGSFPLAIESFCGTSAYAGPPQWPRFPSLGWSLARYCCSKDLRSPRNLRGTSSYPLCGCGTEPYTSPSEGTRKGLSRSESRRLVPGGLITWCGSVVNWLWEVDLHGERQFGTSSSSAPLSSTRSSVH